MAYVYRHIRLDTNQVFYIGIGSSSNYQRAKVKTNRNIYWNRIVNKTNYKIEILFDELTPEQAKLKEIEFISIYGRRNLKQGSLVNLTDGGDGGCGVIVSEKTRHKLRQISKTKKANLGKKLSKQWRDNISLSGLGRKFSEEHKSKIGEANKNRIHLESTKEKHRQNNLGKIASVETKLKMSQNSKIKKKVIQKSLDGLIIKIYDSISLASIENSINPSAITQCCKGRYLTSGGYKWEYSV